MAKTVLLSAGHSNTDPGIVANGRREADIAVKVRDAVASELRKRGLTVREDENLQNKNLRLTDAIKLIWGSVVAIEFHCNGGGGKGTGVETVYADNLRGKSQINFAMKLSAAVAKAAGLTLRLYYVKQPGAKPDSGTPHKALGFCRNGGLIVELFFLDNPSDLVKFETNFDAVVMALADAIAA